MGKFLGIILICLIVAAFACASQEPRMAVIEFDEVRTGQGVYPEIDKRRTACFTPYDSFKNPDGSTFLLTDGMDVEVLEDSGCTIPKAGFVKIRVPGTDIVGWTYGDAVQLK